MWSTANDKHPNSLRVLSFRNEVKLKMNVLAKIGYDNSTVEIEFPIDDDELDRTLKQNYMPTDTTKPFLVRDIDYPAILSELTGRTVLYKGH